jgi:hypothetical protein
MHIRTTLSTLLWTLALPLAAQTAEPAVPQTTNTLLRSAGIVLTVVMIWTVLYKAVYPFFLDYYHDRFCKTIFWNLFLLFTLTWVFVSLYVVLDVGFYWAWLPWLALFLAVWWLIAGAVLVLRRVPA